EARASIAGLEDLPAQPCRRHRIDGPVPGADRVVSAVVRVADLAAQSSRASVDGCHSAPERGVDCPSTNGGIRVAAGAALSHSRPGSRLRPCLSPPTASDGHTGSADYSTVALAERICGKADRIDPAGLP